MEFISTFASALADLVFPPQCGACKAHSSALVGHLCVACRKALARDRAIPACPRCGRTTAPHEVADGKCRECRRSPPRVAGTVRVGPSGTPLVRLVRAHKYRGRENLGAMLGGWLAEEARTSPWIDRVEVITSVPTHWRHRLRRPLHAADVLAARVARQLDTPYVPLLRRLRGGPHQVGLSYTARLANVRGAFALKRKVVLRNPRILLIDDVQTTGATINECARALLLGGAAEVYAAMVVNVGWTRGGTPDVLQAM